MSVEFMKPVSNPDQPQGRVAVGLRQLLHDSDIGTGAELGRRTDYARLTLAEAMGGWKLQNRDVVTRIVEACVPDRDESASIVDGLMEFLEEDTPESSTDKVTERAPGPDEVGTPEGPEKPLDAEDPAADTEIVPFSAVAPATTESVPTASPWGSWSPPFGPPTSPTPAGSATDSWSTPPGSPPDPPAQPGRRRRGPGRRGLLWTVAALALVAVLVVASVVVYRAQHPMCGPGVPRENGQCIGVSDGSINVASDPTFTTLFGKIKAENDRVLNAPDGAPVVSVAYTAPFPSSHSGVSGQLLREIEGAYIMQLQTNEAGGPNPLGGPPRIQLLLANMGADATGWPSVVGDLQARTNPQERAPVVAVAGIDQSLPAVTDAIAALGRAQIPMVAGRIVADDISSDPQRDGFFGIAPSVKEQVTAAATYLGSQAKRPLLVEDTTSKDLYGRNIATAFTQAFTAVPGSGPLPDPVPFNSGLPGLQGAFSAVLPAICQLRPDAVFFAGRGSNLPDFIRALGTRICKDAPITVYTASDGRLLSDSLHAELTNPMMEHQLNEGMTPSATTAGIRVVVTAQAHPGIWAYPNLVPPQSYAVLNGTFGAAFPAQFPDQRQVDQGGDVIMGHDAMQVIVEAIRRGVPPQSPQPVTADIVHQSLADITSYSPVFGASGPIYFKLAGYAENKNIPITEVTPDGTITLVAPTAP